MTAAPPAPTASAHRRAELVRAWWPSWLAVVAVAGYCAWRWPSLDAFVTEIDYLEGFQLDFTNHYHPMSRQILDEARPAPGYLYPAAFALLLAPLGALPVATAAVVWACLQAASLAALVALSARALRRLSPWAAAGVTALVLLSVPVLSNVKWGQVSVGLVALVLGAWWALQRRRLRLAGALLGVAAAVKLFPAAFVLLFVAARAWRAVLWFAATFALLYAALPAAVLGVDAWLGFEAAVLHNAAAVQELANTNSQSLAGVVDRWFYLATDAVPPGWLSRTTRTVGLAAAAGCLWWSFRLSRRPDAVAAGLPLVALFAALPFVIGTAWPHYFCYLPACQVAVAARAAGALRERRHRPAAVAALVLAAASAALTNLVTFDALGHWALYNGYGVLLVADLALLLALGAAARAVVTARS